MTEVFNYVLRIKQMSEMHVVIMKYVRGHDINLTNIKYSCTSNCMYDLSWLLMLNLNYQK